jgi:hypothetical protein
LRWETLLLNLALCLFVLSMPSLLLCYSAYVIRRRKSFENAGVHILVNVFLAIWVVSMVLAKQLSTLTAVALAGYIVAGYIFCSIACGLLCMQVWKYLQARPQMQRIKAAKR